MPWVQRARVVTPALIGGSGRAPREPLAPDQQKGPSAPGSDSPAGSPEKRIMGVSSGNGRASKAQWPTGSIPVTLARSMHRAVGGGCIGCYTGERLRIRSTCAQCVARVREYNGVLPPPLYLRYRRRTYTILTSGWYAVSGMVGTMRVVKTDNDLVYHRNGICVPGSLPFLNFRARALRSPMARLAFLLEVRPVFGLFPVEPLESPTAPISMAR